MGWGEPYSSPHTGTHTHTHTHAEERARTSASGDARPIPPCYWALRLIYDLEIGEKTGRPDVRVQIEPAVRTHADPEKDRVEYSTRHRRTKFTSTKLLPGMGGPAATKREGPGRG